MLLRQLYLDKILKWKDQTIIKVLTGVRRAGKSTILSQYINHLTANNVAQDHIIAINFEDLEYEELLDYKALYTYINSRLKSDSTNYIFLDEIQKVKYFEKAVDSLYIKDNVDIYITGSNSYMLSSDIATVLSCRYVLINVLPFSYSEFCQVIDIKDHDHALQQYIKIGGFPQLSMFYQNVSQVNAYIEGIYNTVIIKDLEDREIRKSSNKDLRRITDISLLRDIAKYMSSTVGNLTSVRRISNYLISNGRRVSADTVSDYINALVDACIFYEAQRFDLAGKKILQSNKKYYLVDLSIRNYVLPRSNYDLGFAIENIVYLELIRRDYQVFVGKKDNLEIDFTAIKNSIYTYFQVTADMTNAETFEREIKPLRDLKDNYRKVVLTLDKLTVGNYAGIEVVNLIDWLMSENL